MSEGPLYLPNGAKKPDTSHVGFFSVILMCMKETPDVSIFKANPIHCQNSQRCFKIQNLTRDCPICRSIGTKLQQNRATKTHVRLEKDTAKSKESSRDKNLVNRPLHLPQSPFLKKQSRKRPSAAVPTTLHQRSGSQLLLTVEGGLPME
jgi:hypothetical protein